MKRLVAVLLVALASPSAALAWGDTGHRMIGRLGAQALPAQIPGFLRTPLAADQIGELAREPDRSKSAGQPHDADLEPNHFLDVDDEGRVEKGPPLTAMPRDRNDYETALRAGGTESSKAGALYYSLIDGWQQLVKDFAYWRADRVGERYGKTRRERAWYAMDRKLREQIIIRDLGYWAHWVGDGSQPQHLTIHYNGWGNYPNPKGYTTDRIHAPFEGDFVRDHVTEAAVRAAMPAAQPCPPPTQACLVRYLTATWREVEPLHQLWGEGAFSGTDPRGEAFAATRLAAGAGMLRDLVVAAWAASDGAVVGYPQVPLKQIEERREAPFRNIYGSE